MKTLQIRDMQSSFPHLLLIRQTQGHAQTLWPAHAVIYRTSELHADSAQSVVSRFTAANHLRGSLRKQSFYLTSFKGHVWVL